MREIRVRYKQSLLGATWAVLQPLALMLVFTIVFSYFVKVPSVDAPYPVFSYAALLMWTFLASSVTLGVPSLVNNLNLVTKVYFPREILPMGSVAAGFIDFVVATLAFAVMLVWYQVPLSWTLLWVPALVVIQIFLILGVVLPAAALNVFYRDIRFVVPLGVQLWMYATPIIYPLEVVPPSFRLLYALNPMVGIVDSYRRVILFGQSPTLEYLAISVLLTVVLVVVGYSYFKRAEDRFADVI